MTGQESRSEPSGIEKRLTVVAPRLESIDHINRLTGGTHHEDRIDQHLRGRPGEGTPLLHRRPGLREEDGRHARGRIDGSPSPRPRSRTASSCSSPPTTNRWPRPTSRRSSSGATGRSCSTWTTCSGIRPMSPPAPNSRCHRPRSRGRPSPSERHGRQSHPDHQARPLEVAEQFASKERGPSAGCERTS